MTNAGILAIEPLKIRFFIFESTAPCCDILTTYNMY